MHKESLVYQKFPGWPPEGVGIHHCHNYFPIWNCVQELKKIRDVQKYYNILFLADY